MAKVARMTLMMTGMPQDELATVLESDFSVWAAAKEVVLSVRLLNKAFAVDEVVGRMRVVVSDVRCVRLTAGIVIFEQSVQNSGWKSKTGAMHDAICGGKLNSYRPAKVWHITLCLRIDSFWRSLLLGHSQELGTWSIACFVAFQVG